MSRFYFLGDDDLLEIIGNASEPGKVLPHLGKMFASLATCNGVPCDEEGVLTKFDAMISKDGEKVPLDAPITVTNKMNVKDWLKELENGMHTTLAKLLNTAVTEVQSTQASTASSEGKAEFVNWASRFPAQVMILASLVNWSMGMDAGLRMENSRQELENVLRKINEKLEVMAETVSFVRSSILPTPLFKNSLSSPALTHCRLCCFSIDRFCLTCPRNQEKSLSS
jgi:dynein heavy chain 1